MGKTLILVADKRYFFSLIPKNTLFDVENIYINIYLYFPLRIRRKKRGLTYYKAGKLGNWTQNLEEYDKIILFDSSYSKQIDHIISKRDFKNGCFVYCWNKMNEDPLSAIKQLESIDLKFKVYSYNKTDCQKYNLNYNSTFYYPPKLRIKKPFTIDVAFLGAVKRTKRLEELDSICGIFNALKINSWIYVYGKSEYQPQHFKLTSETIDYCNYLDIISSCRAILDIDVWKEEALSLRAMEALFYDKKYITNNANIKKEKFYDPNNIFIIGMDDLNHLYEFIFSEVIPVDEEIKNYYLIDNWIKRFI